MPRSTRKTRKLPKSRTPIKKKITKKKQCGGITWWSKKKSGYDNCRPQLNHKVTFTFNEREVTKIDSIVKELKNSPTYLAKKFEDNLRNSSSTIIAYVKIHYNKKPPSDTAPYVELEFWGQQGWAGSSGSTSGSVTNLNCEPFHIKTPIDDSQTIEPNEPNDNVQLPLFLEPPTSPIKKYGEIPTIEE